MASSSSEKKKNVGWRRIKRDYGTHDKTDREITLARVVGYTTAAPLERLVILRQVQSSSNIINYMGTIQGLKYIHRTEGFRGLFKGNGTNCVRIITRSAVWFPIYEGILWSYRQQSGNEAAKLTPELRFGAVACATIIARLATFPLDMVQGRLTIQTEKSPYKYRGMFHALSTVIREEGPRALYKGYLPSTLGYVVYQGLDLVLFECVFNRIIEAAATRMSLLMAKELDKDPKLRAKQLELIKERKFSTQQLELIKEATLEVQQRDALADAFTVTIAHVVAYPFDVIHRRMQMVGWKTGSSIVTGDGRNKTTFEYSGMVDAFRKTVQNNGFGALYKGWVTNVVKVFPYVLATVAARRVLNDAGVELNIKTSLIGEP